MQEDVGNHAWLQGGYRVAQMLAVVTFIGTCRLFLHSALAPTAWLHFAGGLCRLQSCLTCNSSKTSHCLFYPTHQECQLRAAV